MTVEYLVKRTIYVAECECGDKTEVVDNPPRERLCKCGKWSAFKEISYTGPDLTSHERMPR